MVAVAVALAAGRLGTHARPAPVVRLAAEVGHVARPVPAPHAVAIPGTACYVSLPECSQTPCVELIGATTATAVYAAPVPGVQRARPLSGCGRARTGPGLATAVQRSPSKAWRGVNPYAAALKSLAHRLRHSFPGAP